ncbi:MAG: ATP-binding cassette domain-containing protein [Polyangiaceae bacterium]
MGDGLVLAAEVDGRLAVELACPRGISVLFGPSGAGKSTTLGVVAGLVAPSRGRATLDRETLFDCAERRAVPAHQRRCALVPQSLALFPHMTALENVAFGIPAPTASRRERAREWLERLHVGALHARRPGTFSGGEAQRVALARALASEPRALLLDEPFNALHDALARRIGDELVRLVEERRIVALLVTHDRAHAVALAKHAVVLQEGRVVAAGAPAEVLSSSGVA